VFIASLDLIEDLGPEGGGGVAHANRFKAACLPSMPEVMRLNARTSRWPAGREERHSQLHKKRGGQWAGFQDAMLKLPQPARFSISARWRRRQDADSFCSAFSIGWREAGHPAAILLFECWPFKYVFPKGTWPAGA